MIIPLLQLELKNENIPLIFPPEGPIVITGFQLHHSQLFGGASPTTIIGTEIDPQKSFEISIFPMNPIGGEMAHAHGDITLSTQAEGGELVGIIKWTLNPNDIQAEDVPKSWSIHTPEVPPEGPIGLSPLTVTFKAEVIL